MDSVSAAKSHAVCVPYPAQGHINPMMQLAKLLHSRGFHITFVNTEFNHRRLIRSRGEEAVKGLSDFRFEAIPDGLPPSDSDATQHVPSLSYSTRRNCFGPFIKLLDKLKSSPGIPPVTCIVSDGIMNFGTKAAESLELPYVQLWTSSTCGFLGYLQYRELTERGIVPFKDENFLTDGTLDMPLEISGMSNMRLKDIPSFVRITDPEDIMYNFAMEVLNDCVNSSSIIFNTLEFLDIEMLPVISAKSPRIYPIGPLCLLSRQIPETQYKPLNSSLWKEDNSCIQWLNKHKPNSVLYVNYGSVAVMSDLHLQELAWGIANSEYPFLWIVRPDVVIGESAVLPREFMEEIKTRGFLTSWCPQQEVLSHSAVGVFLTHCGWNSVLEAITEGVPLICWPFFAEQQTNCRYACTKWGVGVEIDPDVKREEVKDLVKEMMEGEEGKRMRKNAMEWKRKAEVANGFGGSSVRNFDRMVEEALRHGQSNH